VRAAQPRQQGATRFASGSIVLAIAAHFISMRMCQVKMIFPLGKGQGSCGSNVGAMNVLQGSPDNENGWKIQKNRSAGSG